MQIRESGPSGVYRNIQRAGTENDYQRRQQSQGIDKHGIEEKVLISGQGMERARLLSSLRNEAALLPELREEKLAGVQEKIAGGFYNSSAFSEELAELLSDSPMVGIVRSEQGAALVPQPMDYRPALMDEVGDKLNAGFYKDNEVMDFVAERLIDLYRIS